MSPQSSAPNSPQHSLPTEGQDGTHCTRPESNDTIQPQEQVKLQQGEVGTSGQVTQQVVLIASLDQPQESHPSAKVPIPALNRISSSRQRSSQAEFPCDQCDKVFPQRYRRVRHIREVHDKEKRHACAYCDKSFFKITSRDRHQLIHLPNKEAIYKWRCSACKGTFSTETSLIYHVEHKVCLKPSRANRTTD